MNRLALEAVLARDVNARVTGSASALTGADAVKLETALCVFKAPFLGMSSPLAVLSLKHAGKELVARIKRCPPEDLPLAECLQFSRGHVRYVSLRAGGHLTETTDLDDLVSWFQTRPHELWYAILDAKLTERVTMDVLPLLPKRAAFRLLMSDRYDLAETMVLDLVPKALVSQLVRRHPNAMAPLDWVSRNLRGEDLVATLEEIFKHRTLPVEYVMASATPQAFKIDILQKSGHLERMTPEDLVAAFPENLLQCVIAGGRLSTFTPDWLKEHFEGADLFFLLVLGGHLGSLTVDWIMEHLPESLVGKALAGRALDPDWVVANVPSKDVLRCLGDPSRLSVDWLVANVRREDLYHAVVIGGHAGKLTREWFLEKLPDAFALRALTVYGHIGPEDRDFLFSRSFQGRALLDAVTKNGLDPGKDMTLEQVAAAYGPDAVFGALKHMNRITSELVDDLAAVLSPEDMKDALAAKGCVDEDEFARFLGGELLLDALIDADIMDQCSIEYICDNFSGEILLRALEAGDHFSTGAVDADCILELFGDPELAMDALELSGTLSMLTYDQAVRAFGSSTALLRRALVSAWDTPVRDPDSFVPLFGDDMDSLAAVVRETTAYARMDPDDFPKYGIPL
jgi:hypothetical protein